MHNRKIIAKGLAIGMAVSNLPVESMAYTFDEYKKNQQEEKQVDSPKENKFENIIKNLFVKKTESKEVIKVNKNIVRNSVLEITLADGQYVQDLSGNPNGYETVKVTTVGDKKLVKADYDNLRLSGIPKVDLSNAWADTITRGAFSGATHLTEFKFPQGVKTIESGYYIASTSWYSGAFYKCSGLTGSLVIPDTVTSVGDYAFKDCSGFNGSLVIPNSVTSIGEEAFYDCSGFTGNLVISGSVTSIGDFAFGYCSGFSGDLVIPDSVMSIGFSAFSGCSGFTGNLVIPGSVTTIGNYAFGNCSGFSGDLIIEDGVISIGDDAFYNCSGFTGNLVIPGSVTTIGNYAFGNCSGFSGELVIPDGVTSIGDSTFSGCSGFNGSLVIPDSVTSIGGYAFYRCSGFSGSLVISGSVRTIGDSAFNGCSGFSGKLVIPDSIISIGGYVFEGCSKIEKVVIKIDDTCSNTDYRKSVIEKLPKSKTYIEMPYNFDITGTWLETTDYILAKPLISTYAGVFKNNEGIGISLEVVEASDIKVMTILKDGVDYNLNKDENGKYIFTDTGDYQVYIETELGTVSNISFKNSNPISMPNLEFNDNTVNIVDKGILSNSYIEKEDSLENFDDVNDLKYSFSSSNWVVENGMLKSETINDGGKTENQFIVNAEKGEKLQISLKTSSENNYDWGYIYLNGTQVYKKSGTSNDFEVIELDLIEGENTIKFMYEKDSSGSDGDDAMFVDSIKMLKNEIITIDCDVLEYRINSGEWQVYNSSFELDYPVGTKVLVEARAKHDGFVSSIFLKEVVIEVNTKEVEDAVERAEESGDVTDINDARDLVNQLPESMIKDQLQDRLNSIFPDIVLERKNATSNLDVYIKSENMLSLSLDTNSVAFEDFSGVEDVEKENAINLTVNSSLPYKINAYMPTQIKGSENNIMNNDILNIRANGETSYNSFEDESTPIELLDNQPKGNGNTHGIDLKLKGNVAHEKDVYKTTIKFEVEQK